MEARSGDGGAQFQSPHGVVIVDKPGGVTSFDVVAQLRRALKTKAVGHAGTLDPMATGVLVVCIGEATKLVQYLTADSKRYTATLTLGSATDTLDADGTVTTTMPVPPDPDGTRLQRAIAAEIARKAQVPPQVSAIHVDGERAYDLARRGIEVALPARPVQVHALDAHYTDPRTVQLSVHAAKGYYVRALARDLAASLGTVGHLRALRRDASGPYELHAACTLSAVTHADLRSVANEAGRALSPVQIDTEFVTHVTQGKRIPQAAMRAIAGAELVHNAPQAWFAPGGRLLAVGMLHSASTSPEQVPGAETESYGKVVRGFRHDIDLGKFAVTSFS
jgi:tRNA pseudouridine55 synthase